MVLGIEYLVLRRGGNDFEQANNKTLEQLNKNSIEYLVLSIWMSGLGFVLGEQTFNNQTGAQRSMQRSEIIA